MADWMKSDRWSMQAAMVGPLTVYLRMPLRSEPWPPGKHEPRPCPFCDKKWIPWNGSRLPCHARCLLTEEGTKECIRFFNEEGVPYTMLAKRMGIPVSVVKSTLHRNGIRMR